VTFVWFNSVFIEKILRTEPDVGKMYLLIKAQNKQAAMDRLQNEVRLLRNSEFGLRERKKDYFHI